jgi:hypothetical protein
MRLEQQVRVLLFTLGIAIGFLYINEGRSLPVVSGGTKAQQAHVYEWIAFMKANLLCYDSSIETVKITQDSIARLQASLYLDYMHIPRAEWSLHLPVLNLKQSRFEWLSLFSSCPNKESLTVSGAGYQKAFQNLKELNSPPMAKDFLGLEGVVPPLEMLYPKPSAKNSCQLQTHLAYSFLTLADFAPNSEIRLTPEQVIKAIDDILGGKARTFHGYKARHEVFWHRLNMQPIEAYIHSRYRDYIIKVSNLKMLTPPSKRYRRKLSTQINEALANNKPFPVLRRTQGLSNWVACRIDTQQRRNRCHY